MIVAAAAQSGGETYVGGPGERHCHVVQRAIDNGEIDPSTDAVVMGFTTDDGMFLDRREAWDHAIECGQLRPRQSKARRLFSEDLW